MEVSISKTSVVSSIGKPHFYNIYLFFSLFQLGGRKEKKRKKFFKKEGLKKRTFFDDSPFLTTKSIKNL